MDIMDTTNMESEIGTKKKYNVKKKSRNSCIVCNGSGPLVRSSGKAFATFIDCMKLREEITNQRDDDLHSKVTSFQQIDNGCALAWHRSCYSNFTSKRNLEVLRKRIENEERKKKKAENETENVSVESSARTCFMSLRKINFTLEKCIFCQKRSHSKKLSQVTTMKVERKIRMIAYQYTTIYERICLNDLKSTEIKYHPSCLIMYERKYKAKNKNKNEKQTVKDDEAFTTLCKILDDSFSKQKGYDAVYIYNKYLELNGCKSRKQIHKLIVDMFAEKGIAVVRLERKNEEDIPQEIKCETIQSLIEEKPEQTCSYQLLSTEVIKDEPIEFLLKEEPEQTYSCPLLCAQKMKDETFQSLIEEESKQTYSYSLKRTPPNTSHIHEEYIMATVEQCEPQTTGLGTLSSTLDLFDSYKPLQEEEKDSDEESFHLPMLDCDDDLESNNKEPVTSDIDKDTHDETEDDILNKFETTGTPDIDPKIEDSILEDIEELCEKKPTEENKEANNSKKETSQEKQCDDNTEIKISFKEENKSVTNCETAKDNISSDLADIETEVKDRVEIKLNGEKQENEKAIAEKVFAQDVDMIEEEPKEVDNHDKKSSTEQIETEEKTGVGEVIQNNAEDKLLSVESSETPADKKEEISVDAGTDNTKEKIIADEDKDEKTEEESKQILENVESVEEKCEIEKSDADLSENMDVDMVEPETELSQINGSVEKEENKSNEVENTDQNNDLTISSIPNEIEKSESMDVENPDIEKIDGKDASENIETTNKGASDRESATSEEKIEEGKVKEDSTQCEISDKETNKEGDMEKPLEQTAADKPEKQKDTVVTEDSKSQKMEPDKCENSNDSGKNLECDDLLDISIIRDADEDNASAIAENANDARSSEKSDNDDQDEGSEKADNELDESEMDQEESLLATDKDDNMDFEDGSSNLGDQDNTSSGNTSDSETKDDVDTRDSENDSKESSSSSALKETKTDKNELDSEKTQTDKPKDVSSGATVAENEDTPRENTVKVVVNGKRSLSETEKDTDVVNKKIKLSGHPGTEEKKSSSRNNKVKTLVNFEKYMQDKKLKNKLSRSDLEQFCLQKICEAIMHKTDVGELHQTIKKQEIIIENLRKDLQQLSKQTRDLDIVNKKLMNELKAQNGNKKPLVPLKITRSVGLQVKLNVGTETNNRRKVPVATTPRTPNTANTNNVRPRTIAPANTNVVRQVAQSPRKTPSSTPLLSQALQNNRQPSAAAATPNTAKRTPIRSKPAETQKPANQNVIVDLTDEDDKAAKNMATPVKILNKTVPMTQAKTINIVQAKPVPNKTINNQTKTVAVGQAKTTTVGAKVGTPTRTVTTLPQGVRLTPTQVKNGSITLPASVVTSSAGTTQLMYVVQPTSSLGQVVTTTAGGTQKAVLLNFQPTNGVLTSTLNGSAVSVIPTKTTNTVQLKTVAAPRKHPAPLPSPPVMAANAALKPLLPKPHLSIRKTDTGIILQWRMPYNLDMYEGIASYQLFAYQETNAAPSTDMWRKVGDVKALALPMACTLTQFADKNKYYFAVRSVDVHKRIGAFSDPEEISL